MTRRIEAEAIFGCLSSTCWPQNVLCVISLVIFWRRRTRRRARQQRSMVLECFVNPTYNNKQKEGVGVDLWIRAMAVGGMKNKKRDFPSILYRGHMKHGSV